MNYSRPELGERLAADYVLGMMPPRARRRFERAMHVNATLAAIVAGWSDRLAPLDALTVDEAPPGHVWRRIDRRVGPGLRTTPEPRSFALLWRSLMLATAAACVVVVVYGATNPLALPGPVATLIEKTELPNLVASATRRAPSDLGLSTMRLGVPERERPRWLRAALLLTSDAVPLTQGSAAGSTTPAR